MKTQNQVLIQLYEADRFASAANPHYRRLAVVLLDNIIELQLRRRAETALAFDRTTWYSGVRQHNAKTRANVFRYYPQLVDFARSQNWISENESQILRFAHRVRCELYHEGDSDDLDSEIAIRLLYAFVKARFPDWRSASPLIWLSPHEPILIEDAPADDSGYAPLTFGRSSIPPHLGGDHKEYWKTAIDQILRYKSRRKITRLINEKSHSYLSGVTDDLRFIRSAGEGFNFFDVMSRRFNSLTPAFTNEILRGRRMSDHNVALQIYSALLPEEERLLDIEDEKERFTETHKILDRVKYRREFIAAKRFKSLRQRAKDALKQDEAKGIEFFVAMEKELRPIRDAVRELAADLDAHNELCVQQMRGN